MSRVAYRKNVRIYIYTRACIYTHTYEYIYMYLCKICMHHIGVATISRLLRILGLFCRIWSLSKSSFAEETCHFKQPTNQPPHCIISIIHICLGVVSHIWISYVKYTRAVQGGPCVTWLIHLRRTTFSSMSHDSFTYVVWLIHACETTHTHTQELKILQEMDVCVLPHIPHDTSRYMSTVIWVK